MDYRQVITIDPKKRSGKPCIRGLRMTVYDVLEYLAAGMTHEEILNDFPDLTHGWIVGDGGVIRTTSDAGQTWSFQMKLIFGMNCTNQPTDPYHSPQ